MVDNMTIHQKEDHLAGEALEGGWKRKLVVVGSVLGIFLAFIILSVILRGMKPEPEVKKRRSPVLAVMADIATSDNVDLVVNVQGQTRPRIEIDLVPEVAGKIISVSPKFIQGGVFEKGDVLMQVDRANYNVAVVRAEAAVARAQQVLVREQAEAEIARKDWEDLGEGAPSDLTLRKPQMAEAKAGLQSAQADLENAKIQLRRTYVRAPFNGRVKEKFADLGQYVGPGARLGRIFSTDAVEVTIALTDSDLTRLDLPVAYVAETLDAAPNVRLSTIIRGEPRYWSGKIVRTDSVFDPQTRSLIAIAELRDPYGKGMSDDGYPLPPGLVVDAEIKGLRLEGVIVIPRDALRPEDKVYVVDDKGVAHSRDAVVLDKNPNRAVLSAGVEAGEMVITSPLEKSQISVTFKVLDVNDPNVILVEPPEPEPEAKDEGEDLDKDKKSKKKKKGDEEKPEETKAVSNSESSE